MKDFSAVENWKQGKEIVEIFSNLYEMFSFCFLPSARGISETNTIKKLFFNFINWNEIHGKRKYKSKEKLIAKRWLNIRTKISFKNNSHKGWTQSRGCTKESTHCSVLKTILLIAKWKENLHYL